MSVRWVDLDEIKEALLDVRSDKTDTNWALLTYDGENTNNVKFLAKGDGGVPELTDYLQDNIVGYGLIRVVEKFDEQSDVTRFIFLNWQGEKINRMLRAKLGTHSGAIKEILSPYHVDFPCSTRSEISEDMVRDVVRKNAGIASRVRDKGQGGSTSSSSHSVGRPSPSQGARSSPSAGRGSPSMKGPSNVPGQSSNLRFADEDELRAAIRDVRSDSSSSNWVLATYDGPNSNTIVLVGAGSGGSEELLGHLKEDMVGYGLVRQEEQFDESSRVMFAFVNWVGENINRMQRARLGTHSGAVKEMFSPFHVDINASNWNEISPDIITTTIQDTMGTNSKVKQ